MYTGKGSILAILLAAQYYCEKRRASIHVTHSHLTTENWFTSVRTEEQLLVKNLTVIGTLKKKIRQVPKTFLEVKIEKKNFAMFAYREELNVS